MLLALYGYAIVIIFMALIMSKKLSALTSLLIVPVVIGCIAGFGPELAEYAGIGMESVAGTAALLLFAVSYFCIQLGTGMFDPLAEKIVRFVKGDPVRVTVGTVLLALAISLDGDGATTYIIVCTTLVPIYKRLKINILILPCLTIMCNAIMNILPWGGPTARVLSGLELEANQVMPPYYLAMILASIYMVILAYVVGKGERKRLGTKIMTKEDLEENLKSVIREDDEFKRPKLLIFNWILTVLLMVLLITGLFPSSFLFGIGTAIALMVNYHSLSLQSKCLENASTTVFPCICLIFSAGCFMGILQETGMSDAIAQSLIDMIPESMGSHFGLITSFISIPGTFFLSNDAFYFGIVPILADAAREYGFTNLQIGLASLTGQAFHLLSPLIASNYLLLNLTGCNMGEWQRKSAKWSIGVYLIYVITMFGILRVIPL